MRIPRAVSLTVLVGGLACSGGSTGSSGDTGTRSPPTSPPSGPATVSVGIQDFSFAPANVNIRVGTEVSWTNNGPSNHTTTSDAGLWDSGSISPPASGGYGGGAAGGSYRRTFDQMGTFAYRCSFHPSMRGTIVVSQ
ncbi:MAG: plastocyanin/azurin family copper-binding protein [Gemmatimonadota bacterium]